MIARLALVLAACAAFLSPATAASVPLKAPGTVIYTPGGGWTTKVGAAERLAVNSGQFSVGFTTQVGGKPVNMPATMRLAANAGNFAAKAVRLNPAWAIGATVATWLIGEGIEYYQNQWHQTQPQQGMIPDCIAIAKFGGVYNPAPDLRWVCTDSPRGSPWVRVEQWCTQSYCTSPMGRYDVNYPSQAACPAGWIPYLGRCIGQPATDSDFDRAGTVNPLPDTVAAELAPKAPLPVQNPSFNPKHVDVPLGDPVENPVSKQLEQPKARVTPQNDGQSAEVTPYKDKVNPDGSPVTDPNTGTQPPPQEETDPCKLNPDTIGCSQWGEPDNVDDLTKDKTISLTPQGGFGPDNGTCPAPLTHNLSGGKTITMSYEPVCRAAGMFRPAVIGMAWLSALLLMFGIQRQAQS